MKVSSLMHSEVRCCLSDEPATVAARIMWEHDCGFLPVVDSVGRVVGVVTDRDLCMAAYTTGRALAEIQVVRAMSDKVHAVTPGDPIARAEEVMREYRIRRLPVVDGSRRIVGVITLNDLARASATGRPGYHDGLRAEDVAVTLARVCEPRRTRDEPASM